MNWKDPRMFELVRKPTCKCYFAYKGCLRRVLTDFSLTVKAVTLIFISGRGSAISFAKEGKPGFIYDLHFMKNLTVYTLNSYLLTLKARNHKLYVLVVH